MFRLLIFPLLMMASPVTAQFRTDTVINMQVYKSYFNYSLKQPLYVTYHLEKGGGDCNRESLGFFFKNCSIATGNDRDYAGSNFDKGHLANAEDFAYDCDLEEKTFCYFNCVPQKVKLNRGVWKQWEQRIRLLSQKKRLFIITGSIFGRKRIGANKIGVPLSCYKIVLDAGTKEIIYCKIFPNNNSNTVANISLKNLKKKLGYDLVP